MKNKRGRNFQTRGWLVSRRNCVSGTSSGLFSCHLQSSRNFICFALLSPSDTICLNNNKKENWFQPTMAFQVVGRVYCALAAHATDRGLDEVTTNKKKKEKKKKNMAVECHKALANIRSELVVIGVPFTTDPHHRLLRRVFYFLFFIVTTRFFSNKFLFKRLVFVFLTQPVTGSTAEFGN